MESAKRFKELIINPKNIRILKDGELVRIVFSKFVEEGQMYIVDHDKFASSLDMPNNPIFFKET